MTNKHDDYHDRLIDQALREKVGGKGPPDLSEKILAAIDQPAMPAARREARGATRLHTLATIGLSACLLIALALASSMWRPDERTQELARRADELHELIDRFYDLMQDERYAEAETIARQAYELAPRHEDTLTMVLKVRLAQRLDPLLVMNNYGVVDYQNMFLAVQSEEYRDESAMAYPDAPTWRELFRLRSELRSSGGGSAADFDSLGKLITTTVEPETWDEVGGPGEIEAFEGNLSLMVTQSQEVEPSDGDDGNSVVFGLDKTSAPTADLDLVFNGKSLDGRVPQFGGFNPFDVDKDGDGYPGATWFDGAARHHANPLFSEAVASNDRRDPFASSDSLEADITKFHAYGGTTILRGEEDEHRTTVYPAGDLVIPVPQQSLGASQPAGESNLNSLPSPELLAMNGGEASRRLRARIRQMEAARAAEAVARRHALAAQRATEAQEVQQEVDRQKTQLQAAEDLNQREAQFAAAMEKADAEKQWLQSQIQLALSDRNAKFDQVVSLTDSLNAAQGEFRNLRERNIQLAEEIADRRRVMDTVGLSRNHDVESPLPRIDGIVTAVIDSNLVELSLGFDDGLREGHTLDVFNGNEFRGRVVVRRTFPDRAVAEVLEGFGEGRIRRNDSVATRLGAGSNAKTAASAPKKPKRTWRRAQATPNAARLVIGEKDELLSHGMQASVVIDGFRARVLLDYYFYNDRDRQLEGSFKLRLPDEASLFYFAFGESSYEYRPQVDKLVAAGFLPPETLRGVSHTPGDILRLRQDGLRNVKEARVVPREKAAYAYSETTRRRIDPALVEWAGAGVFNAKVFPLAPQRLHRIVIGYDVNLEHDGSDLVYRFDLPADIGERTVDINLSALAGVDAVVSSDTKPFTSSGRAYYHIAAPDDDAVTVRLKNPGMLLLSGIDETGGAFFALEAAPDLDDTQAAASSERAVFLLDTSLSSNPERFNLWLALLRSVLENNRDSLREFALLTFDIDSHWWREGYTKNTPENVEQVLRFAESLALEGATDLGAALREAAHPTWPMRGELAPADLFLLSDGAATWGETGLPLISQSLKGGAVNALFAYKTGMAGTAGGALDYLARETGGAVFSVASEEQVAVAAVAHRRRPWRLEDAQIAGGSDLLIAGRPRNIYPGQQLLIAGRGAPAEGASLRLQLSRGDERREVEIPIRRVVKSELAPRVYGQTAVGQLEDLGGPLEEVATAYARHFRVAGRTCSLLMLESEADYQRFEIKPEDDAFVVSSSPASATIDGKLAEQNELWQDPKQRLLAWLDRLESLQGVNLKASAALKLAIDRLPPEALAVKIPRLQCKLRNRDDLPEAFLAALVDVQTSGAAPDYDRFSAEAERRRGHGAADALAALSSLVEHNPGDMALARDVAYSAMELGLPGQAYSLLLRAAHARPYEPQAYQALGHCLAELDRADLAVVYFEVALQGKWDGRFGDYHDIVAVEYLHLLERIERGELNCAAAEFAAARREALRREHNAAESDIVITMQWNTDRTDVDLHVVEPSGEDCHYNHPQTASGGRITSDVTQGFGPEMYTLRSAPAGKYDIKVNYYGADANRTSLRTKVYLTVYENFATPAERVTRRAITLGRAREMLSVATVKR